MNQDSLAITNRTFDSKIYVANFFFTSCTTICPHMQRVMKDIFEEYKYNPDVMFLSHTIDYKYDTPSKLKRYAQKLDVDGKKWQFAYGSKEDIYGIAEQSYMSAVIEDAKVKENFIHQGYLLLVDKNRRVRGAYDSDSEEQIAQLKSDINTLLQEH
ncbi:SCO family protein [Pedobacter frigoris]|uniref:SCO family protein n=1 Tax=Pedobacter frigoris TaxID=2571272 RepID=UPI00292F9799|nr:SCO family protein [Pedobacter frigoris]